VWPSLLSPFKQTLKMWLAMRNHRPELCSSKVQSIAAGCSAKLFSNDNDTNLCSHLCVNVCLSWTRTFMKQALLKVNYSWPRWQVKRLGRVDRIFVMNPVFKFPLGRSIWRKEDNIKMQFLKAVSNNGFLCKVWGFHGCDYEECRLSLQPSAHVGSSLADLSTLKMEAIRSSETSVNIRSTRRHIPEDGILQRVFVLVVLNFPDFLQQNWGFLFWLISCRFPVLNDARWNNIIKLATTPLFHIFTRSSLKFIVWSS
jgi:hypothetical protein